MGRLIVHPGTHLRGRVCVPGDKSISHRALLLGALAEGDSRISGFLPCGDCLATLVCLRTLGVEVETHDATTLTVHGRGLHGLRAAAAPLDCARSGTTMRLLAGLLAGQPFDSVLTGDPQLLRRPMRRVVEPLRRMGAEIATSVGQTFQPADAVRQAFQPADAVGQAFQPADDVGQAFQPADAVGQAFQPADDVGRAFQPADAVGQAFQPADAVGQAFQPADAVGQAFQPADAVGRAFQPADAVGQAFQPADDVGRGAGFPACR